MRWPFRLVLVAGVVLGASGSPARAQEKVDFQRDIRPLLSNHCFKCHGPAARKAGLRLDVRESATKRRAIVPGQPDASKLVRNVEADDDSRMPPPEPGERIRPTQVALLKK